MIVTDASALVIALTATGDPQIRSEVLALLAAADEVHGPDVVGLEVLHALRGLLRGRRLDEAAAETARSAFASLRITTHLSDGLAPAVWALRDRLSAYDAAYLAVAERISARVIVTADRGLATVARDRLGARRVVLLGAVRPTA